MTGTLYRELPIPGSAWPGTKYARVAILGDSITTGYISSNPGNDYAFQLIATLQGRSSTYATSTLVDGHPGMTAGQVLAMYEALEVQIQADLLIVEFGTNEFVKNWALTTATANYRAFLAYLRETSWNTTLIGTGVWSNPTSTNGIGVSCASYNTAIEDAVTASGFASASYVALGSLFENASYISTVDNFHPNDAGHAAIANAINNALP